MKPTPEKLDVPSAMDRYGIVCDVRNFDDAGPRALAEKLYTEVLGPFYDTDEVGMTGIGLITRFYDPRERKNGRDI